MAIIHRIGTPENDSEVRAIKRFARDLPGDYFVFHNFEVTTGRGLPYEYDVAVLSPHAETIERMLHPEVVTVEIWQDDLPLPDALRGADVTEDGRVLADRPRMFNLIRNPGFERHELTLRVKVRGFALYAFSFTGCVKGDE